MMPAPQRAAYNRMATENYRMEKELTDLKEKLAAEKQSRIKYQDIVYGVCNAIDRATGRHTTKGNGLTVDKVLEAVSELTTALMVADHQHEEDVKALECVGLAQDSDLWASLKQQRDDAIAKLSAAPAWHRRPTCPGRWLCVGGWKRQFVAIFDDDDVKETEFWNKLFYGPIPDPPEEVEADA